MKRKITGMLLAAVMLYMCAAGGESQRFRGGLY